MNQTAHDYFAEIERDIEFLEGRVKKLGGMVQQNPTSTLQGALSLATTRLSLKKETRSCLLSCTAEERAFFHKFIGLWKHTANTFNSIMLEHKSFNPCMENEK